jgi:hypothetical protein
MLGNDSFALMSSCTNPSDVGYVSTEKDAVRRSDFVEQDVNSLKFLVTWKLSSMIFLCRVPPFETKSAPVLLSNHHSFIDLGKSSTPSRKLVSLQT